MLLHFFKKIFHWTIAIIIGFCIVNILCFFYERPVGWIETPNGPSPAVWNPETTLVHGTEGYGIIRIDQNGYVNPKGSLQNPHVLCMGSSHTQGKELSLKNNYSSLINDYFSNDNDVLTAYNIACDANFLPSLIKHFPAAVETFPNASAITIEISNVTVSAEELENALEQVTYNENQTAQFQLQNFDFKSKLKIIIKEYLPLLSLIKSKLETTSTIFHNTKIIHTNEETSYDDVAINLNTALELMRSEYDGEIIFIYHSQTIINNDGTISFVEDKLFDTFEASCKQNDIVLLDMRPTFVEYYEHNKEVPYGFSNTKPGNGHLNKLGHRLIAEALIPYIKEALS